MRTNVVIDDVLMNRAMEASGAATKKAAVEQALRLVVQIKRQEEILDLFGKVKWDGDLDEMRTSRFPEWDAVHDTGEDAADKPAA